MKFKSYLYSRCEKIVKSIIGLTRHVNTCKILINLPTYQPLNLASILEYNTINYLNFISDNSKKDISQRISNNSKKRIRSVDIDNNKEDIRPVDISKK